MIVRDGDGTMIDFQWPSFAYWFKAGIAATFGVAVAVVVLWFPMVFLYLKVIGWFIKVLTQALLRA